MTVEESEALLAARWSAVEEVVRQYGGDPASDLTRDGVQVRVKMLSAKRVTPAGSLRDPYIFQLSFNDYDDHAPRIRLCDPADPTKVGVGRQFYPTIEGNNVFGHETFLCMPGDRTCYETSGHLEWRLKQHFHPEVVVGYLFELVQSPTYKGREKP